MKNWFWHGIWPEDHEKNFFAWSIDKECLWLGWGMLFIVLGGYAAFFALYSDHVGEVTCFFRIVFHVYCPVCGGSRAALYMITGHWLKSLYYNPVVLPVCLIGVPYLITNTLCYATKGKCKGMRYQNIYLILVVAIAIINCIWKNYVLLHDGIALIP